jgi:hypothetical protein
LPSLPLELVSSSGWLLADDEVVLSVPLRWEAAGCRGTNPEGHEVAPVGILVAEAWSDAVGAMPRPFLCLQQQHVGLVEPAAWVPTSPLLGNTPPHLDHLQLSRSFMHLSSPSHILTMSTNTVCAIFHLGYNLLLARDVCDFEG